MYFCFVHVMSMRKPAIFERDLHDTRETRKWAI